VWCRRTAACACLVAVSACAPRQPPATLHALAEDYVRLSLQLAQHRPTLVDAWTGPAAWRPGPRVPVADLRVSLDAVNARAERLRTSDLDPTEAPRLAYLRGQLRALSIVTRRLLGESPSFAEELRVMFGRDVPVVDDARLRNAREALAAELEGESPLNERYVAFRRQFVIPAAQAERVLVAAIGACRRATMPHVTLPADERVDVEFDPAIARDAYARYTGGHRTVVTFARRQGHDVAALLHTACLETYAGHHMQHVLVEDALVRGRGWVEFQLTPAFGPHQLIAEGAAETAVDLALPEHARAAIYRNDLLPLAGLPVREAERLARVETLAMTLEAAIPRIVQRYLDNTASSEATLDALRHEAFVPAPEQFLAFAERQRTGAVVYPLGKAVVSQWIAQRATGEERWRRLRDLFTLRPFTLD
jgi:hypothetical protein